MPSLTSHKICRDADASWWELRVSTNSSDCYRPHTHNEYSIGIVDAGTAVFRHPEGPTAIGPGAVVLIEPRVVHCCNPEDLQRWTYRMLFLRADWLHEAMSRHWGTAVQRLEFLTHCTTDPAVEMAVHSLCRASPDMTQRLAAELPPLLATLARPASVRPDAAVPPALAPAESLLRLEGGAEPSVKALAEACGMTPSRFIRLFRKHYGMTPGDYLQNRRVNEARNLLGQGMSISEAAFAMGFADQAHLQRTFKARHAMTPGHYRDPRR